MQLVPECVNDVYVYDMNEKQLVHLDTLKKTALYYSTEHDSYVLDIQDAAMNTELLKLSNKEHNFTDMQKMLGDKASFTIGKPKKTKFKLLCKSYFAEVESGESKEVFVEIQEAELISKTEIKSNSNLYLEPFQTIFKLIPNTNEEYFKVHISN
ncbi:hypothetical protein ABEY43_06530 [Priestia megaterium]